MINTAKKFYLITLSFHWKLLAGVLELQAVWTWVQLHACSGHLFLSCHTLGLCTKDGCCGASPDLDVQNYIHVAPQAS